MPATPITVSDGWLQLSATLTAEGATVFWRDAIETVSQSESGYERVYQGTCLMPIWDLKLEPGHSVTIRTALTLQEGA
jgi:4-alpha-glucanotransferase